jgi:hypothetical protein
MKTDDLLRDFKSTDPEIQKLLIAVAEHAYHQGRRDQSEEMFGLATAADKRASKLIGNTISGEVVTRLSVRH